MISTEKMNSTNKLLDEVISGDDPQKAIYWLRCAYWSHESSIDRLLEDIQRLQAIALAGIQRVLTVEEARAIGVCRVCRTKGANVYNYGEEFSHSTCLRRKDVDTNQATRVHHAMNPVNFY